MVMRRLITEPEAMDIDPESSVRLQIHRRILKRKRMIREVFSEFHHLMMELDLKNFRNTPGSRIELGAGVYPIRESYPGVMATDVVADPALDRVLDAQSMDVPSNSVRALYGQNCFHHFPDPEKFFSEALRVLNPGGGIILIEPFHGPVATLVFQRLFTIERFDKEAGDWDELARISDCKPNQALSHNVFKRDLEIFERKFPGLELLFSQPLNNYVRYLGSGGLNFRQLFPDFAIPGLKAIELLLSPLARWLSLHHIIVVRKR